ncbi:Transposable element Tcb1 transposase [Anthophora retusa]
MGSDGKLYVRRRVNEEFSPKCIKSTVKGGGGSVNVWGAFTLQGVGPIHRTEGIMDQYKYIDILNEILLPFTRNQMPDNWILQADIIFIETQPVELNNFCQQNVNILP